MVPPNTSGNPLSAGSLALFMAKSLPENASPQLKSTYDAVALAVHAGMIAVGFRLIGLGEDHRIEASSEAHDLQPLPTEWNASSSSYAFRYAHAQSSMEYLVKVNRLGSKAVVFALAIGDDKTSSFEITVNDFISPSSIPSGSITANRTTEETMKTLQDIFISVGRLSDLGSLLQTKIIQKLAPGIQKEGYEETPTTTETRADQRDQHDPRRPQPEYDPSRYPGDPAPARPYPFDDPLAAPPRRPIPGDFPPPGFEDEYEINRPPRGPLPPGGRAPFNIGEDDLYPPGLGPHDPIRPHFGGGLLPRPGFGGQGGGGGMHPTFDDPLFQGQGQGGYDPQVPPGARYDPLGPGGHPGEGRGRGPRFPGGGGGMGGRPPNPFGGFGGGDFI
ncbi:hypothetical protein H2201_000347 [Coniosporium apollinis]|uniref:Proteasome inhibitor PI31 subunit n=1 Tax=Coniosporium apollinis TaxID=61459 RepID=A0ABQ9P4G6_9PEZI|nr:hypothetical protein H2201_000347 [Coniosporium apollinis]